MQGKQEKAARTQAHLEMNKAQLWFEALAGAQHLSGPGTGVSPVWLSLPREDKEL